MNRIYQGRVTKVQMPAPASAGQQVGRKKEKGAEKNDWIDLPDGEAALWRHHEVFQDAVNYDAFSLAFMAEGMRDSKGELTAMGKFAQQVRERWEDFTHKGKTREGMRRSLSRTLGIKLEETTWEECGKRVFANVLKAFPRRHLSPDAQVDVLHGVMAEMFPPKSRGLNPQKMARGDWPWLCWNHASGESPAKAYYRKNHGINDFMAALFHAGAQELVKLAERKINETYLSSVVEEHDEEAGDVSDEPDEEHVETETEQDDAAGVECFKGAEAITKWKACCATLKSLTDENGFSDAFTLLGGSTDALALELSAIENEIKRKEEECKEKPDACSFQKWSTGGKGKDNASVEIFVLMHLSKDKPQVATALKARLLPKFLGRIIKDDPPAYLAFVDQHGLCGAKEAKDDELNGKEPFAKVNKVRDSTAKAAARAAKKGNAPETAPAAKSDAQPCSNFIQAIRDQCGVVFPGFTAVKGFLSLHDDAQTPDKRVAWEAGETDWKEFEFAALEEALKAPNQIKKKTEERDKERAELEAKEKAYDGTGRAKSSDDDEGDDDHIPGFKDDLRLTVIQKLHATLAVADGVVEGEVHKYGFSQAALRGFEELQEAWNKHVTPEEEYTEAKKTILKDKVLKPHQQEHRDDVGAVLLFEKLLEKDNWCLWRNPTPAQEQERKEKNHSGNIVRDYMRYLEIKERIDELKKPVQYTPADAALSRRLYDLKGGSQGGFKHGGGADGLWFETQIAIERRQGDKIFYHRQNVRIHYTAPRLLRDGSRALTENENLKAANWMQPMVKALKIADKQPVDDREQNSEETDLKHDFSKHAVSLMPDWSAGNRNPQPDRLLLNFVLKINKADLTARLRKTMKREKWPWTMQFNWNRDGHESVLRWPHEDWSKVASKKDFPGKWFDSVGLERFRVLSVDLGQKQAGAFAIVEFSCAYTEPEKAKARYIGMITSPEGKRVWYARVIHTGLHRLQGEDARVYRPEFKDKKPVADTEKFREELSGSAGRQATLYESRRFVELLGEMKQPDLLDEHCRTPEQAREMIFYPEQNYKLLVTLRRAQSFAAKLHRWCWYLAPNEERKDQEERRRIAIKEIAEADAHEWLPSQTHENAKEECKRIDGRADEKVRDATVRAAELKTSLANLVKALTPWLEEIANRIYHSRSGCLKWKTHPDKGDCHLLAYEEWPKEKIKSQTKEEKMLAGQRGLSIERIEQMEELRKRCQSLNQTLRRKIGDPPPRGRDDSIPDPCPAVLAKLDGLKEQRRNQTAHMILAEALGLALATPKSAIKEANKAFHQAIERCESAQIIQDLKADRSRLRKEAEAQDLHGEYVKVNDKGSPSADDNSWREVVDFIVIEDLGRYKTSQGRAPRENSRLMKWCHRAIRDKLKEMCEPFGIPLVETPAAYSSRFCSRTGVAGFRASELSPPMLNESKWRWRIRKRDDGKEETKEQRERREQWESLYAEVRRINAGRDGTDGNEYRTLLVHDAGGGVFIPISNLNRHYQRPPKDKAKPKKHRPVIQYLPVRLEEGQEHLPRLIHADINAAVNLALRCVAHPRIWSIHSRLRSEREAGEGTARPKVKKKSKKSEAQRQQSEEVVAKPDKFFAREKRKHGTLEGDKRIQIVTPSVHKALKKADAATTDVRKKRWQKLADKLSLKASESRHPNFFADVANLRGTHWGVAELHGIQEGELTPAHLVSGKSLWGYVKRNSWKRCQEINAARTKAWEEKAAKP
ncbi:MAG: type V CRISPR-associated protein Cas12b [Verrucomicrobiaceae bacterium]|nr:type V CRISPR-associated protein Cas12b [Verrucomicrobiaceae bacterium]